MAELGAERIENGKSLKAFLENLGVYNLKKGGCSFLFKNRRLLVFKDILETSGVLYFLKNRFSFLLKRRSFLLENKCSLLLWKTGILYFLQACALVF